MKKQVLSLLAALGLVIAAIAIPASAQTAGGGDNAGGDTGGRGRGRNMDPAQFRQQMMDRLKADLGASDDEFKVLQPKIEKINELRMRSFAGRMGGGRGRGPGGGDANAPASDNPVAKAQAELEETSKNKDATDDQIKAKLAALRDARAKAKEELTKAQTQLREVLTVKQEAVLVARGILE